MGTIPLTCDNVPAGLGDYYQRDEDSGRYVLQAQPAAEAGSGP